MGTVFTAAEAIGSGQTYWQLSAAVRRQQLGRPWRGIYLTNLTADWLEQLAAVVHAAGDAVISHGAAARLHGLWGFESDTIELTLPPGRRFSRPGVRAHQSRLGDLSLAHPTLPVTSLASTLIDLAGVVDELALTNALESAWCQDRYLLEELDRRLGARMRGRRGIRRLRRLIDDARRRGRPLESPLEVRFWRLLHEWKLPLPQAGVQVNDGDPKSFRFDFLYPSCSLAIETDGYRWHREPEIFASDCQRQSRAAALGYRVMRLTWADLDDPEPVRERLLVALGPQPARHTTRSGAAVPWPRPSKTAWPAARSAAMDRSRSASFTRTRSVSKVESTNTLTPAPASGPSSARSTPTSPKSSGPSTAIARNGPTTSTPAGTAPASATTDSSAAVRVTLAISPVAHGGTGARGGSLHTASRAASTVSFMGGVRSPPSG